MLFHDVVNDERYDLWIADEGWEIDYYLHEHPELKRANYAWLTDFVGFLPMPDGGEHEAFLTADYNAQMVEHIDDHPEVRDRAIFVGNPDDIVDERLGPDLPMIRDWTEEHYDFAGYVTGFDPEEFGDHAALRASSATTPTRRSASSRSAAPASARACCASVIAAHPAAKRARPGAADDRRRRARGSTPTRCPTSKASRSAPTSTTSTAIWRPATSRSPREG